LLTHAAGTQYRNLQSLVAHEFEPGLFMNRRDDCAEICPHKEFSD
jgi:hypothetical protein